MSKQTPKSGLHQTGNSPISRTQAQAKVLATIKPLSPSELKFAEAEVLLKLVKPLTATAVAELSPIQDKINHMVPADPRLVGLSDEYERIVRRWSEKLTRLGVKVLGLWQVGFDSGDGWWSWQYPETRLRYFQEYDQEFSQRQHLNGLRFNESDLDSAWQPED